MNNFLFKKYGTIILFLFYKFNFNYNLSYISVHFLFYTFYIFLAYIIKIYHLNKRKYMI